MKLKSFGIHVMVSTTPLMYAWYLHCTCTNLQAFKVVLSFIAQKMTSFALKWNEEEEENHRVELKTNNDKYLIVTT